MGIKESLQFFAINKAIFNIFIAFLKPLENDWEPSYYRI